MIDCSFWSSSFLIHIALIKLLSSYEYVIENFVSNLSVPVALASSDLSYYKNKDFINQINRGDIDELNIQNKIKLFNKFKKIQLKLEFKKRKSHYIIKNTFKEKPVKKEIKKILSKII